MDFLNKNLKDRLTEGIKFSLMLAFCFANYSESYEAASNIKLLLYKMNFLEEKQEISFDFDEDGKLNIYVNEKS